MAQLESRVGYGRLVWPVLAIMLGLAAPLTLLSAFIEWFGWFGLEPNLLLDFMPPVILGVMAFVCGLKGREAAKRQGKGKVLATVGLVISCLPFLLAVAVLLMMMYGGGG